MRIQQDPLYILHGTAAKSS